MRIRNIFRFFEKVVMKTKEPTWFDIGSSWYNIWKSSFQELQEERAIHGQSSKYWHIWYNKVCPAYQNMTKAHRRIGVGYDSLTYQILKDMEKGCLVNY